ncbi:Myc-type [Macleaya cordata]|uniref:Myc-type n=1 Tax=Macleaya cordata TaxID=56857 RepID=A0A200Q375_MACCD|nr:Myc-type [Macleaya cordata]
MDQWKPKGFCQSIQADLAVSDLHQSHPDLCLPSNRLQTSFPESSQRPEVEAKDSVAARKVQKADREKLRRDRLNEQFLELGNALDPDRPKNDKATILADTIQMLKDLTAQVNRLKEEYATLSEESNELTQEKNELREEKASLKSDIENLNMQYQQRVRVMFPWTAMDPSVVMGPHTYPYPVPVPVPAGPIPMHPSLQPFPFFRNQNPGAIPNPCSTFVPFSSPANPHMEQLSTQFVSPHMQPSSRSHTSSKQDSKSKSSDRQRGSNIEKSDDSNDVATELELKIPGSTADQEVSYAEKKGKRSQSKDRGAREESCSSRCSSRGLQDSSSNSVGDGPKAGN